MLAKRMKVLACGNGREITISGERSIAITPEDGIPVEEDVYSVARVVGHILQREPLKVEWISRRTAILSLNPKVKTDEAGE